MKALFQNPKAALAYVGITLAGVVLFVGTEEDPGSLHQTVNSFTGGKSASDRAAERKFGDPPPGEASDEAIGRRSPRSRNESADDEIIEWADDEELIDGAEGFDPTPVDDFGGFDPNPDTERPFLSDQDKKKKSSDDFGGWASEPEAR